MSKPLRYGLIAGAVICFAIIADNTIPFPYGTAACVGSLVSAFIWFVGTVAAELDQ